MRGFTNRIPSRQFIKSSLTSRYLQVDDTVIISVPEDDLMAVVGTLPLVSLHKRVGKIVQINQDEALVQLTPMNKVRKSHSARRERTSDKEKEKPLSCGSLPAVSHLTAYMMQRRQQEQQRQRNQEQCYEQVTVPTFVLCLQDYVLHRRLMLAQSNQVMTSENYRWTPELAPTLARHTGQEEMGLLGRSLLSGRTS